MLDILAAGYLDLHPAEAARTLSRLDERELLALLGATPPHLAAGVLSHTSPATAARQLEQLDARKAAEIVARMAIEPALARLRVMPHRPRQTLLAALPRTRAARLRLLLRYPEGSIGALVESDVLTLTAELRVGDALRLARRSTRRIGHSLYVLDERRRLKGAVAVPDLLSESDRVPLSRILQPVPVVLNARISLRAIDDHPAWLTHDALPVVNREGVFQGVLPRSSVLREERSLLAEVETQRELSTTRLALADLFYLAVAALFTADAAGDDRRDRGRP